VTGAPAPLGDQSSLARLYPPYPLLAVSLAVFRNGEVLLATRTRPPFVGAFSLPGGLVEAGETLVEAALRELREEVHVEARIVFFNRHVESIERDEAGKVRRHFVIASYVGEWVAGEGTPGPEAGEIIWAEPSRLARIDCTPYTAEVVAAAAAALKSLIRQSRKGRSLAISTRSEIA
jgi:8-oxo-dGTP diphosphatase